MNHKLTIFALLAFISAHAKIDFRKYEEQAPYCSCEYLTGDRLYECMEELDDAAYKESLKNITYRTYQRKNYFQRVLQSNGDYHTFFNKFTDKEWQDFRQLLTENEKSLFPQEKSQLDSFLTEKTRQSQWNTVKNELHAIREHPVMFAGSTLFGMVLSALIFKFPRK